MKKISVVCLLVLCLMVSPCFAIQYCKDFLEPGNLGGWSESLKTFDDEWRWNVGEEVELDIWINDVPEELFGAGFWITYDPSLVSIEEVLAYDNADLPGPWSPLTTTKNHGPEGPVAFYWLILGFSGGSVQDVDGDIILGRVRLRCISEGETTITISVDQEPGFDSFAGFPSGIIYDDEILPNTFTFQSNQAIPTLSEWGIIIFMALILGISVVMLYRRRET